MAWHPHARLIDGFVRTQEILALAGEVQHRLNTLLQRPQPGRQFSAADVDIHLLLQGDEARRLPNPLLELERLLGLRVHITAQRLDITERLQA